MKAEAIIGIIKDNHSSQIIMLKESQTIGKIFGHKIKKVKEV